MIKLFNNILAYRMTADARRQLDMLHPGKLEDALDKHPARNPSTQQQVTLGFAPPIPDNEGELTYRASGRIILCVVRAERMLPGKVVRAEVAARVRDIEQRDARRVYAREKQQLKDEVILALLPRAFIDHRMHYLIVDGPYIYVDTSSAKRGEEILSLLRDALGTLPVRPVAVENTPIESFTRMLTQTQGSTNFGLTGDFKANDPGDELDCVTGKGVDAVNDDLIDTIRETARRVTVLGLVWTGGDHEVRFTLNEMLGMKGIKWPESLTEVIEADTGETEDDQEKRILTLEATFLLLTTTIASLWSDLLEDLGGEALVKSDLPGEFNPLDEPSADDEEDLV